VPGASVVEPDGEVVSVCVTVELGVVTVTVAVVVAVEPLDPPQAGAANTAASTTTLNHPSECPWPMAGDCTGLQDISTSSTREGQSCRNRQRRASSRRCGGTTGQGTASAQGCHGLL
jgi:hypothetical protein